MRTVVRFQGGLGNQLFQYSSAYSHSKLLDKPLALDTTTGFQSDKFGRRYALAELRLPGHPATSIEMFWGSKIARFGYRVFSKYRRSKVYIREPIVTTGRLPSVNSNRVVWIDGVWANEENFCSHAQELYSLYSNYFESLKSSPHQSLATAVNQQPSVAVHVRSFTAMTDEEINALSRYYDRAMKAVSSRNSEFFVFTDDGDFGKKVIPSWAAEKTHFIDENAEINALNSLYVMALAPSFVGANSTFSWWSAWLGEKHSHKRVFVLPSQQEMPYRGWNQLGLIPLRWSSNTI